MFDFDKIKDIIHPSPPSLLLGYSIHLDSTPHDEEEGLSSIDKRNKIVTIYINNLSAKESAKLKKAIKDAFGAEKVLLIEKSKVDLINRLYKYDDKNDNRILTFFKAIISDKDWQVLRDSLFLRNEFKNGRPTGQLKSDIISRYGERGRIISNLCTAGYFEETMMPLYNHDQKEFYKYYDIAVDRAIAALFVNSSMTVEKISIEITNKLKAAKAYGLSTIHIHGIGDKNILRIKECLDSQKVKLGFAVKTSFEDKAFHVYVAEILF